ncbi:hypothetical protein F0U60_51220 [Archangium minus]|uniref:Integral membrane protein n=1 Tax=Archangium minus TaxID=83450 RepID=A0ABY9X892_9BACT|nr:hypothetical protein F0U61_51215 [Archangium violaceum]WNG51586.1 hypothetical protein F0U60_51220 [Archangium minus]
MPTPTLTTSAYVLHNLGLAAGFGGSLFGRVALNPSAKLISDKQDRAKIVNAAWNGYNVINAIGLGSTALTWFFGRSKISGRSISPAARKLVIVKDFLMGATLVSGLVNLIGGGFLAKRALGDGIPMESGSKAADEAPADVKSTTKLVNWLGVFNLACMAGIIGVSTWLDNTAQTSSKWKLIANVLP